MKLTEKEVKSLRNRMNNIIENPQSTDLARKLALYWLDRINTKGKYALREDSHNVVRLC